MSNILISPPPTTLLTGLLQLSGGVAISSTPVYVTDQNNTASPLALATANVNVNTTSGSALVNIKGTGATSSSSSLVVQNSAGTSNFSVRDDGLKLISNGGMQFSYGSSGLGIGATNTGLVSGTPRIFANGSDHLFIEAGNTTNALMINSPTGNVGVGIYIPTARLNVKGSGSTSATTSLLVQNSSGVDAFKITDDKNASLLGRVSVGVALNSSIWANYNSVLQVGQLSLLDYSVTPQSVIVNNQYFDGSNSRYYRNGGASGINFTNDGSISLDTIVSGTAGNIVATSKSFYFSSSGNMGIGTTTPFRLLDVNGDASINTVRVGLGAGNVSSNTVLGTSALNANTTGSNNAGMGIFALAGNLTGSNNTAIGSNALRNNTNSDNTAVGYRALLTNTSGSQNTSVGTQSSYSNLTGVNNVSVGNNTLFTNSTGSGNTAIGASALFNQTGSSLTAVGYEALFTNVSGTRNTAIGNQALRSNTASNNTALGNQALYSNTTGGTNTAIGDTALRSNTNGEQNTALGYTALYTNVSGTENVGLGYQALFNSEASRNVAIGANALLANTTGERNTAVGYSTSSGNFSNSVILGYGATATGSNQFVVGSVASNAGSVVVGANVSSQYWNVKINGVDYKILLA